MKLKLAALALLAATPVQASECGTITIADMNWASAGLIAQIDGFILENGFNCEAELVPGDTVATATSMIEKGQPNIAPELWTNAIKAQIDQGVAEGRLAYQGSALPEGGDEGFWVPEYLVEKYPELKTIAGVKKHSQLFKHPEDPSKSAFYGCPAGWACQISTRNLFYALNLAEAGFELVDPGSGAGLSGALAKAYTRQDAWFGYYWSPTDILGKYKMVKVDFGTGIDEEVFSNCISQENCDDPTVTMYPSSAVSTVVTSNLVEANPDVMAYLAKRGFKNSQMNELLAWMDEEQADSEDAMYHFFENYSEQWQSWVDAEVAKKIKAQL